MRSRKQLALLAYLTTEHALAHSRETLLALFWPEETTASAQNNLRVTLSRLREVASKLDPAATDELLVSNRNHIQLHPTWIDRADVNRFNHLLESTRHHAHTTRSQCAHCQAALLEAIQLYQGDFLTGLGVDDCPAFEEWLFMQRERLHLLALEGYADLAAHAETSGDLHAARRFAQRQIELDPLREPAYRQQMRILAKQGERSLALNTFERCRTVLREELGLDPEAETLALHTQILQSGVPTGPGNERLPDEASIPLADGAAVMAIPRTNLPHQLTSFIGREEELAQLRQRLQAGGTRLLSLVGPGGIGKTRLALQVAAENLTLFAQGVCFVPLAGVQRAAAIPTVIIDALAVSFVPGTKSPIQQLCAVLAKRQMLLILDNFEQLMDGVDLLLELLQAAPAVTLLVTTREQLNCQAEDLFTLDGLPTPTQDDLHSASQSAAVRLFCDRAYRLNKAFKLTAENCRYVIEICQRVAGLPLAIELATTWLRDFDCADLAAAIRQGEALLATTQHDVPVRHRSMQAVFMHSWQLLSPIEQRLLSQLAVCPGPFSVQAATAMTGASLVDLTRLRYKSLLRNAGSGYYEFHPLIRGFAVAMLTAETQQAAAARLATVYMQRVAEQGAALYGPTPQTALHAIGGELENIHYAWQWAQMYKRTDLLLQSVSGLGDYYAATGRSAEGEARFLRTYAALFEAPNQLLMAASELLRLHLLDEACRCLLWQGKLPTVLHWAQMLVQLAQAQANQEFIARGLTHWGNTLHLQGKGSVARPKIEEALALARQLGNHRLLGHVLYTLGAVLGEMEERSQAEAYLQEGLTLQRQRGNWMTEQRILVFLSRLRIEDNDYQSGRGYLAEAMHLLQRTDNRPAEARIVNTLGYVEAMLGNYPAALEHHAASRRISQEIQQPMQESHALHNLCTVYRKMGNLLQAEAAGEEALRLALVYDIPDAASYARLHLGYVWLACGDPEEAAAAFQLARDNWQSQQRTNLALEASVGLAAVAYQADNLAQAALLIAPVVPILATRLLEGTDEPFEIYLTCYRILSAQQDPQAAELLATAYTQLQLLASKITDKQLRHSFWHTVPAHRQIRALWQQSPTLVCQKKHRIDCCN